MTTLNEAFRDIGQVIDQIRTSIGNIEIEKGVFAIVVIVVCVNIVFRFFDVVGPRLRKLSKWRHARDETDLPTQSP